MARKQKYAISPERFKGFAMVLGVATIGFFVFKSSIFNCSRNVRSVDGETNLEHADSLPGNVHELTEEMLELLSSSQNLGTLIATEFDNQILPVLRTPNFSNVNIQKSKRLIFFAAVIACNFVNKNSK
jgi:hypothetical protein